MLIIFGKDFFGETFGGRILRNMLGPLVALCVKQGEMLPIFLRLVGATSVTSRIFSTHLWGRILGEEFMGPLVSLFVKQGEMLPVFLRLVGATSVTSRFKNSSPKNLSQKLLTWNGCKTSPTILRKMGSISPCLTHKPKVILPRFFPQYYFARNYWHRMGAFGHHGPNNSEKNGQHFALFYTQTNSYSPKILPQEFFPKNSSPKIISQEFFPNNSFPKISDIEWAQTSPTILRKMGSISPCFTHKPKLLSQEVFPQNSPPKNYWHRMGAKKILTSWPQQFWENWAAFRPVLHKPTVILPKFFPKNSSPKILPQKLFPKNSSPIILSQKLVTSNGRKHPQQFWEKWAAFRPVLHTNQSYSPKKSSPKILPPKIIDIEWVQKKSWHHGPNNSEKIGQHFALFYTNQQLFSQNSSPRILPQKFFPKIISQEVFPKNSFPKIIDVKWVQNISNNSEKNGQHFALFYTQPKSYSPKNSSPQIINIEWVQKNLDIMAQQLWEKWAAFRPVLHTNQNYSLKILHQDFFPQNSSPKTINIKWVQKIPDIMAPTILRKLGRIFALFYTNQELLPNNSSPGILPPKFFPPQKISENYFPRILPQKIFPQNCWHRMGANIFWHHGPNNSETNGQHFAPSYTNQKWFTQKWFSNSSPKSIPPKILTSNGRK